MSSADLDQFMAQHSLLAFEWGSVDCSLVLADWAIAKGHDDPAQHLRGLYSSEEGWKAIVTGRGGLLPLVSDICARAGIEATDQLRRGVVGVIGAPFNVDRQWGAIFDGSAWQVRHQSGFAALRAQPLGMWIV